MPGMKWRGSLAFDFFVGKAASGRHRDAAIEWDGGQHHLPQYYFGVDLAVIRARDRAKNLYCGEHSIDLLRIDVSVPLEAIPRVIARFLRDTSTTPGSTSVCRFVGRHYAAGANAAAPAGTTASGVPQPATTRSTTPTAVSTAAPRVKQRPRPRIVVEADSIEGDRS